MMRKKILTPVLAFFLFVAGASAINSIESISPNDGYSVHHDNGNIQVDVGVATDTDTVLEFYTDGTFNTSVQPVTGASSTESFSFNLGSPDDIGDHTFSFVLYEQGGDNTVFANPSARTVTIQSDADVTIVENVNPSDGASFSGDSVTYEYRVNGKSGDLKIRSDTCSSSFKQINTQSYSGGFSQVTKSYSKTFTCSETIDWNVEYVGDDGSTTDTFPNSFTLESDANQVSTFNINNPTDLEDFNGDINQEKTVNLEANINSPQGGTVEFLIDGNQVGSDSSFTSGTIDLATHSETLSDGFYNFKARFEGDDGSTTSTSEISFDINDFANRANPSISNPNDGEVITSDSVTFDFGNSGGGDGDVKLYVDGIQEASKSFTSGNTESYSATVFGLSAGSHNFYVEYQGDDGSSTSTSTKSFTIGSPPSIDSISVINSNPQVGNPIDVSYQFSDDLGLKDYQVTVDNPSGSQIASTTGTVSGTSASPQDNGLFTPSTDGTYTIEVTLSDDDNLQTTQTKTVTISSESAPSFNIDKPVNNAEFSTALNQSTSSITFSGNINSDFSGTTKLFVDGSEISSQSLTSGGDTYSFTETVSKGSHTYTIKAVSSASGSVYSSSTPNFDVVDQDQNSPISFDNWTVSGFQDQETATIKITADDSTGVGVANISFKKNSQSFQTVQDNSTIVTFSNQQNNSLEYFATDYNGNTESSNIEYVALDKQSSVNPDLQISPSTPKTGETVTLNASGSEDTDGSITSFSWDLNGDGVYGDATGPVQSKTFAEDGAYTVSVNVSGSSGFSEVETKTVNIQNRLPNPSFNVSTNNLQIEVNASNSSDPDGSISQYQWDWTNNLQFDDSGETATHNFSSDGNYNVKLTVTDNDGDIDTVIKTVSVSSESSDTSPGTGGGGGGGSSSVDATTVFFNSERSETETYTIPFDETVERELVITNTQRREINVNIDRGSSRTCDIIRVQQSFGSDVYGSGGSYDLSEATESFGSVESSNTSILKIDAPTRSEVQEKGLQNITCSFDTVSSYGEAENLEVIVEFNDSLLNRILRFLDSNLLEIPVANMSSADPEVQDRVSVPFWMVLAGILLLVNLYLYRN